MTSPLDANPGCLGSILQALGLRSRPEPPAPSVSLVSFPYRIRGDFLSAAELSFYQVLAFVVGDRAAICPKVGLAEVLYVAKPNLNHQYRNMIAQKHVDFILCEPTSMRPRVAIEVVGRNIVTGPGFRQGLGRGHPLRGDQGCVYSDRTVSPS